MGWVRHALSSAVAALGVGGMITTCVFVLVGGGINTLSRLTPIGLVSVVRTHTHTHTHTKHTPVQAVPAAIGLPASRATRCPPSSVSGWSLELGAVSD